MAKKLKLVISLLLAAVLVVGTLAGCGKSNNEEDTSSSAEEASGTAEEAAITATEVTFSKSGQYTTTVIPKRLTFRELPQTTLRSDMRTPTMFLKTCLQKTQGKLQPKQQMKLQPKKLQKQPEAQSSRITILFLQR